MLSSINVVVSWWFMSMMMAWFYA